MKVVKRTYCEVPTTYVESKLTDGFRVCIRRENFNDVIICKGNAIKGNLIIKLERSLTDEEIGMSNDELVKHFM